MLNKNDDCYINNNNNNNNNYKKKKLGKNFFSLYTLKNKNKNINIIKNYIFI